jgi:hypothetical protein
VRALAHHAPGIDLGHGLIGERGSSVPAAGAEQKYLLVRADAGGGDVSVFGETWRLLRQSGLAIIGLGPLPGPIGAPLGIFPLGGATRPGPPVSCPAGRGWTGVPCGRTPVQGPDDPPTPQF